MGESSGEANYLFSQGSGLMIIEARRGRDVSIDSSERVLIRIQGSQWRLPAPAGGTAIWAGEYSAGLNYFGDRAIEGSLWIGKTKHSIRIYPGG